MGTKTRLALVVACTLAVRGTAAALLCRTITAPPGASYLYSAPPSITNFNGNSLWIDGNDHALDGGIATRTEADAQDVRDSLTGVQMDNVAGRGFDPGPPIVPSIAAAPGPDAAAVDQLIGTMLSGPHVVVPDASITGNATLGTPGAPLVTHLIGQGAGVTIGPLGSVLGFGVLAVEDGLTVQGSLGFGGLAIVRGPLKSPGRRRSTDRPGRPASR